MPAVLIFSAIVYVSTLFPSKVEHLDIETAKLTEIEYITEFDIPNEEQAETPKIKEDTSETDFQ
jgi:hypothetical protein